MILRHTIFWKIYWKLRQMPVYGFIPIMLVLMYIIAAIFSVISPESKPIVEDNQSLALNIVTAIIMAPLFESFIFQYLPTEILYNYYTRKRIPIVFVSGFLFGIVHCYDVVYMIVTFFFGVILAGAYVIRRNKNNSNTDAFMSIVLIHAIWNTLVLCAVYYA